MQLTKSIVTLLFLLLSIQINYSFCETLKEFSEREKNMIELLDDVNNNLEKPFILPINRE